jgi:hypothetical protein
MKTEAVALRAFHCGELRSKVFEGERVLLEDKTARALSAAGFVELTGMFAVDRPTKGVRDITPKPVRISDSPQEKGEGIPTHLHPNKKHVWESELLGNGEKTCARCGVTMHNPLSVNVSKKSLSYTYTDAYGVQISSLKELPCPLFVGDVGGGIANNTYRTRTLRKDLNDVGSEVDVLKERMRLLEERNLMLEEFLREKLGPEAREIQVIDVDPGEVAATPQISEEMDLEPPTENHPELVEVTERPDPASREDLG